MQKKIKLSRPFIDQKERNLVDQVLRKGWLTNGPLTQKFEKEVCQLIGSKFSIAVNSCTNGIIAVIEALNLKKGEEVLTTPMTFVSVIHALELFELKIKLLDVNFDNFSISLKDIEKKVSKKTKCVLITHYGGIPVDTKNITNFCKRKKIHVIEDAATAFGSRINSKMVGSSDYSISVFSFYANKTITTGEGGVITLKNKKLASKIRNIISCGISKDPWKRSLEKKIWNYDVKNFGYKFNFTDIQAAVGLGQLEKFKKILKKRKLIRKFYNEYFSELIKKELIYVFKEFKNQIFSEYIYTILLNKDKLKKNRDDLIDHLKLKGIDTTVHYIPANKHRYYKKKFSKFNVRNSDYIFANIVSIPFHNHLSKNQVFKIAKNIIKFVSENEKK